MPRRTLQRIISPQAESLRDRLIHEFRKPKPSGEPLILEEGGVRAEPRHIYVVWEKWDDMPQVERSEIIFDAYTEVEGDEKAMEVTVAMGLTRREATELKLKLD